MDIAFTFEIRKGRVVIGELDCTMHLGEARHGGWVVKSVTAHGVDTDEQGRPNGRQDVELTTDDPDYARVLLAFLAKAREVDEEWNDYIRAARIGNRADAQRDVMVSRELLS
jgi:hypothetical protein